MKIIDMDAHPPLYTQNVDYIGEITRTEFFARLEHAGIDRFCGTLLPPPGFFEEHSIAEAIIRLNDSTMELGTYDARYIPVLWVHPDCTDDSISQLEKHVALGARIMQMDATWLEREEMYRILEYAEKQNMAVSLQGGNVEHILCLTKKFPLLKVLIGGISDKVFTPSRVNMIMETCPQVYLKLSSNIWRGNYTLHEWGKRLDNKRILFGTGYPYSNPASKVGAILWELRDHEEEDKHLIFWENAMHITRRD